LFHPPGRFLVRQRKLAYTDPMHSIDPKWTDLAAGYQNILFLQARLESEFGRAVQAGNKQNFRRQLTEWQKKRRIFFVMAALAPLSIITLCLAAYYYREAACVIVYWAMLVLIILGTLAVAGRNYIREVMNRPSLDTFKSQTIDLEQRWWESLSPVGTALDNADEKGISAFMRMIHQAVPGTCLAIRTPEHLLFSPAGIWLFQAGDWSGTIIRQEGVWKQIQVVREKLVQTRSQEQPIEPAPDEAWLQQKNKLVRILNERLPQQAWVGSLINGGVVFTHPKAQPDKARIQGNTAAYGTAKGWVNRIRRAPTADGFPLEIQLDIADALHEPEGVQTFSAKEQAGQLYQAAAGELRQSIAKMVN